MATGLMSEYGNGGVATNWVSLIARAARPARRTHPIVRLPRFRPSWPTKEAHRRALNQSDGLLRSEAGRASAEAGSPQRMIKEASKTSDRVTLYVL